MPVIADLSKLPPPEVVAELDYETIFAERKARFIAEYPEAEQAYWQKVLALESEPVTKLLQECAYAELLFRQDLNQATQANMLAYATGSDLDHLAANVDVERLVIQPADESANPPIEAIYESDEALRLRVQEAFETLSTAGPRAAYQSLARRAHGAVKDVSVTSPDGAEVVIAVLSHEGDGTASKEVLAAVTAAVSAEDKRPIADRLTIQSAEIVDFEVDAVLSLYSTPDYVPVIEAAKANLQAALTENYRIGADVDLSLIYAALRVEGVQGVQLNKPAANVEISELQAARCVSVSVVYGGIND